MRKPHTLTLACSLCLITAPALAETLAPMVVTPTRTAQTVDQVSAAVTVFTRDDIKRSAAQTLDELLVGVPGVAVANTGGYGKQTGLFLRGTESNHTLVLMDGVRINNAKDGAALIQNIPLRQIDRVEVVRGPRSSLYGSDALGGVIQIFTRRTDKPFAASSSVTAGSKGTTGYNQYLGGNSDGTRWNLSLSSFDTNGEDALKSAEPDDDGYDNKSVSASIDQQVGDSWTLGARLYRSQGTTEFDDAYTVDISDHTDFVQQVINAHADVLLGERATIKTQVSRSEDRLKDFADSSATANAVSTRDTLSSVLDYLWRDDQTLTLGIERSQDHIDTSNTDYEQRSRYNNAIFGQWLGHERGFNHQLSLRYDDNQQFDGQVTGTAVLGYAIESWLTPYVSYGTAFVTPTFVDLYYPGYSNPDLKPEEGRTVELGLKGHTDALRYSFNVYQSWVDHLIIYSGIRNRPENVDKSRIKGAEASLGTQVLGWNLALAAGYTQALDDETDQQLIRRPRWSGRVSAEHQWQQFDFRAAVRSQGQSEDTNFDVYPSQRVYLGGFALVDMSLGWQARPNLYLQAKVNNLFDRNATTVYDYNGRGRLILGTLRYDY